MKTYAICPISDKRINERVARTNAVFTVLLLFGYAITTNLFLMLFLVADFLFRSTSYSKYSLVGISSRNIVKYLSLDAHFINAGPKIFAARIGFIFSTSIVLAMTIGVPEIAYSLAAILCLFSFLEAAFGFCVAYEIYPFVYKIFYRE